MTVNKRKLLEVIINLDKSVEENNEVFFKNFIAHPQYKQALEIDNLLILGEKGVGKSQLANILSIDIGRRFLVEDLNIKGLPLLDKTLWINSFSNLNLIFPNSNIIESLVESNIDWNIFWIGLLLERILQTNLIIEGVEISICETLKNKISSISEWIPLVTKEIENINYALDILDKRLLKEDKWLFIIYDNLDKLSDINCINKLLLFWVNKWKKWERIIPKIFLSIDIFEKEILEFSKTKEAALLKNKSITLKWRPLDLYELLLKRLANSSLEMKDYINSIPNLIRNNNSIVGTLINRDKILIERFINLLVENKSKEVNTYNWIINHLKDTKSNITPDCFIKLFSIASEYRLNEETEESLLKLSNLKEALIKTSEYKIKDLNYYWLESFKDSILGLKFPILESEFLRILENKNLPFKKITKELIKKGVLEIRSNNYVNIPEIYLHSFNLKKVQGKLKRR